MAELIEKLTMRAYSTAKLMNEHAEEGDLMRNNTNCGALSELMYVLHELGVKEITDATYKDGDYFRCKMLVIGDKTFNF